jgi:hypothetical protein
MVIGIIAGVTVMLIVPEFKVADIRPTSLTLFSEPTDDSESIVW